MFNVPPYFTPRTLTSEGFKIFDDKLRLIKPRSRNRPTGCATRWIVGDRALFAARAKRCDAACARPLIDGVLAAMIAHAPAKAPLDKDALPENGQPLAIGDGL